MRITNVEITNFRGFDQFALDLPASMSLVIGANGVGKSSLITAIARALGRDLGFAAADFHDLTQPVEIVVTLAELSANDVATFANHVDFGPPNSLRVSVRATWNTSSDEADIEHRFPKTNARSRREERDAIPLDWLSAGRQSSRMLRFGVANNLLAETLSTLPLHASLAQAVSDVQDAATTLAADPSLANLLASAASTLGELVAGVQANAVTMGASAVTPKDLLRQFEVLVSYGSVPLGLDSQSSGISQLMIFAFALIVARAETGRILLIDEPEISLHPQSQRALVRALGELNAQTIVATHSAHLVDRGDPRRVFRLFADHGIVSVANPSTLTVDEANRMSRFTNSDVAEAFFAKSVVLVEGLSDRRAVEALAMKTGRNLDAEGISVVAMNGASNIQTFLKIFGPNGFRLKVAGLCDEAEEPDFVNALQAEGLGPNATRADRESIGFFVNVADLEDELIRALGTTTVNTVIHQRGETSLFQRFQQQPGQRGNSLDDQQRAYVGNSRRKVEYAGPLLDAIPAAAIPAGLTGILRSV